MAEENKLLTEKRKLTLFVKNTFRTQSIVSTGNKMLGSFNAHVLPVSTCLSFRNLYFEHNFFGHAEGQKC